MTTNEPDPDVSQAELAGVTPAAFTARIARARSQLTAAAKQAQQSRRTAPRRHRVRFLVPPWGWVDYTVDLDEPDPQLTAVGVVRPGYRNLEIEMLAGAQDQQRVAVRAMLTGAVAAVAGGELGNDLHWPGLLHGVFIIGLGGAGIAAQVGWRRFQIRNRQYSRRLTPTDEMFLPALSVLVAFTQTRMLLTAYPKEMKHEAKQHGLQPVPLPNQHQQVPAAIHQALWDLLGGASAEPPDEVLQAVHELADAVLQDIWFAWNEFDSFLPAPLTDPAAEAAQLTARTTPAADLRGIAGDLAQDRAARERAVQDVRDINDNTNL
jgi:hypothetical protein